MAMKCCTLWRSTPGWTMCDLCCFCRINKGQGVDIKSLSSRSVLTVTNMTEDRFGNYTCVAANKLGTANASVSLIGEFSMDFNLCSVRALWKHSWSDEINPQCPFLVHRGLNFHHHCSHRAEPKRPHKRKQNYSSCLVNNCASKSWRKIKWF